jgi:hypothetical protein
MAEITSYKREEEMKARKIGVVLVLALTAILVIAWPAWAKAVQSPFEGQAVLTGLVDWGTCTYPDGMEICRGLTVVFTFDVDDARFSGPATTVINSSFHMEPYHGQQWGTFELVNDGGSWDGTWTGVRNEDGSAYLQGVAQGHGGYEGLKVHLSAVRLSPDMFDPFECTGYILEPHGE